MAEHAAGVTTGWQEKTRAPFFLLRPACVSACVHSMSAHINPNAGSPAQRSHVLTCERSIQLRALRLSP